MSALVIIPATYRVGAKYLDPHNPTLEPRSWHMVFKAGSPAHAIELAREFYTKACAANGCQLCGLSDPILCAYPAFHAYSGYA
jgi:hypothetical protein